MYQELQRRIANTQDLDFGDIFSESISLFKKTWLQGFLVLLLTFVIAIPAILVVYVPLVTTGLFDPSAFEDGNFSSMGVVAIGITIILYSIAILVITTLSFALQAAFYRMVKNFDYDDSTGQATFGMFFKPKFLKKCLVLSLATIGICLAAYAACILPILYVIVPIQFFILFFAFNPDLSVSEIINLSFKLGNKKWFLIFGLTIVASILAQLVGFLLCFVGVFFTASFTYLPIYLVYKKVIGFNNPKDTMATNISQTTL